MIDALAATLAAVAGAHGSERRLQIREAVAASVAARGADRIGDARSPRVDFLRRFDLGFRIRRLRMLGHRLSALEAAHDDTELGTMREAIYTALASYLELKRTDAYAGLRDAARAVRGDAGAALDALGAAMDLPRVDADTDERLAAAFAALARPLRRAMLPRLSRFPLFRRRHSAPAPGRGARRVRSGAGRSHRPRRCDGDPRRRRGGDAEGHPVQQFRRVLQRGYRENDYLWGRLHGADR